MPYGYYQLVRFLGMVGFAILAYHNYESNRSMAILWIVSAILINPIFKITLGRALWNAVDVLWAALLMASIFTPQLRSNE